MSHFRTFLRRLSDAADCSPPPRQTAVVLQKAAGDCEGRRGLSRRERRDGMAGWYRFVSAAVGRGSDTGAWLVGPVAGSALPSRRETAHDSCVALRLCRLLAPIAAVGALASGCSGSGSAASSTGTAALPPAGNSTGSLKATAVAWAHAFLVGSYGDIKALQGPECTDQSGTTLPTGTVNQYLRAERAVMAKEFGRPLNEITIKSVATRNVTSSSGDALVEYDLPAAVVGNDNWVSYAIHNGRWKVSDCHAPIGGSSSSASASVVPTR